MTLRSATAFSVLAVGTLAAFADDNVPGKAIVPPLVGGYTIVKGESDGKPIPEDRIAGAVVKFTADEVIGTDKEKKQLFAAKYALDTSAEPWKVTMKSTTPKESEAFGLAKKEGDTVVLIYALPGGKTPTEFKTQDKQNMFWLKAASK